jgi:peptidoglycan glycosyltransferase
MKIRITGLTVVIVVLFALVLFQAWFVQVHRADALNGAPGNPSNTQAGVVYPRGLITGAGGIVLARSIPTKSSADPWRRSYPMGALTSDVVGYASISQGTGAIEYKYNSYLVSHRQPARSWSQWLEPVRSADTVALSLEVPLQQVAARALAGRDGAVVAIDPRDGSVLAMYSNPTYNPAPLTSLNQKIVAAAWKHYTTPNANRFPPLGSVATQQTFPPGSTFKVVTTSGILRYYPALATYSVPYAATISLPNSNQTLTNSGGSACGGTIVEMLPVSCDPGYATLGMMLGGTKLAEQASDEGYNQVPPLDLGSVAGGPAVVPSYFPPASYFDPALGGPPQLAYAAIGQGQVRATALQNALIAAGIADHGNIMAPHFMRTITDAQGNVVRRFHPWVWHHALGPAMAAQVTSLMQGVVNDAGGTANGVGFLPQDEVAAKTGTAQTSASAVNLKTDDWMIAFAPASHPVVAVAVVVPNGTIFDWGATVAGPVVKCVIEAQLAINAKLPPAGTGTTCPT